MLTYNKPFNGKLGKPEVLSKDSRTETAGFISAERRITSLIQAGQRLQDFRESQFDFKDDKSVDLSFYDPTREPGYDLADASMALNDLTNKKQAEELKKASQTAIEAPEELQDEVPEGNPSE